MEVVGLIRDVVIIGFAGMATLLLLVLVFIGISLYRKLAPILDSTRKAAKHVEEATTLVAERVVKPVVGRTVFAHTAGQVLGFLLGFARRKGGK